MPRGFHADPAAGTLSVALRAPAPPEGEPRGHSGKTRFAAQKETPHEEEETPRQG